ncbi:hypothetical protein DM02DRAFT_662886 [Periconia macrospinosa]|uniref:Uncharacterized protein n=1 Tax=Periconia macrospinosa TaxID=97972 RepID=A0A2V1D3A9_9PLEO|nr:hypothetical protein DM02DRAFT_662886 [Periconia macrospinosa]
MKSINRQSLDHRGHPEFTNQGDLPYKSALSNERAQAALSPDNRQINEGTECSQDSAICHTNQPSPANASTRALSVRKTQRFALQISPLRRTRVIERNPQSRNRSITNQNRQSKDHRGHPEFTNQGDLPYKSALSGEGV